MNFFDTVNDTFLGTLAGQYAVWACIDGPSTVRVLAQIMGIEDQVNASLFQAGTGLSLTQTPIPGFEFLSLLTAISLIGIVFIKLKKRSIPSIHIS